MEQFATDPSAARIDAGIQVGQAVGRDIPCIRCGRSLMGAAIDGACACGEAVSASICTNLLRFSGKRWVKSLVRGAWAVTMGLAAILVLAAAAALATWGDDAEAVSVWSVPIAILIAAAASGGLVICGGEFRRGRHQLPSLRAQAGRGLAIVGVILNVLGTIAAWTSGRASASAVWAAAPCCLLVAMMLSLWQMASLARRTADGLAVRLAQWAAWMALALLVVAVAGMVMDPLAGRPRPPMLRTNFGLANASAYMEIGVLGLAAVILGLVLGPLAVVAALRFARACRTELVALRRIRSTLVRPHYPQVDSAPGVAAPASDGSDTDLTDDAD